METLCQRLAQGDQAAFAELYDVCAGRCHHYVVSLLGSRDAADEVMQESFLRLVRNRSKLGAIENVAAYLFVMVRHEALRFAGRCSKDAGPRFTSKDLFLEATSDDVYKRDLADLVAHALESLGSLEREVVELKIYGGLTFREIAQVTDVPLQTAATRYRSALERLKTLLAGQMT